MATYQIKSGDTLSAIAKKYNTTVAALASANGISDPNKIIAGKSLTIPSATPAAQPAKTSTAKPTQYAGGLAPDDPKNKYNTATGKLNPNYVEPGTQPKTQTKEATKNTLAGDSDYEQLDTDNKSLVDYFDSILQSQDEQKKLIFKKLLS